VKPRLLARLQPGLVVHARYSFDLANQAIDSDKNSESYIHPEQRNKHQHRHLEGYDFRCRQKNDYANEAGERNSDASDNL
jgi:hypothetical protein